MAGSFLVIGSNSFSGAHFCDYLLTKGHEVIGLSRSVEPNEVFLPYKWQKQDDSFRFEQADLNSDLDKIKEVINDIQPKYIFNFAAQGMVAQSWQSPQDWYETNVVAQVKLHDYLRQLPTLEKYVHVTTPEVYGSTEGWIRESFVFSPSTPYAVSRAACDLHLMSFFKAYNFPVVFTRAANVYGPGQQLYRIIPRTMLAARLGRKLPLHGGGHSVRSFIHMEDVADATYKIALDGQPGETYHISTNETVSIRQLVEIICEMTNVKFDHLADIVDERLGKDQAYLLESSKIRQELNWEDTIQLRDGLLSTLSWVDDNLSILEQLPVEYIHKR